MKAGRRANIQAQREPGSRALRRYCDAALVTAGDGASVEPAVGWLRETVAAVDIPTAEADQIAEALDTYLTSLAPHWAKQNHCCRLARRTPKAAHTPGK